MNATRWGLIGLFLLLSETALADRKNIQFVATDKAGGELQLEVRQAPLAAVLDEIADATGVAIHYSVLPQELVIASCAGSNVSGILTCLLERKADLVYKYRGVSAQDTQSQRQPEEVWVLGTELAADRVNSAAFKAADSEDLLKSRSTDRDNRGDQTDFGQDGVDDTDTLLKMTGSNDPAERADALALLAVNGPFGDADIRKVLETALTDKDANVRAQALSSLARRDGDGAAPQLQAALADSDVSVRLMAVDSAGNNPVLLQQAVTDSDETVRTLATMKLEALVKSGGRY